MSQQEEEIRRLVLTLIRMTEIDGPLLESDIRQRQSRKSAGPWSITHTAVTGFLQDQGLWVHEIIQALPENTQLKINHEMGVFISSFINGVLEICPLRDSENRPNGNDFAPVLPHQLAVLRGRDFAAVLLKYQDRLKRCWSKQLFEKVETEQSELRNAYLRDIAFKAELDKCDRCTSFATAWRKVGDRFECLRDFSGTLATIFPNTASVESDFSILGWEKDEYRTSLTDISLEGILQSKQYKVLSQF